MTPLLFTGKGAQIAFGIDLSNIVLEAVGNAKTTNNNNSSRFGKYLVVTLDGSGALRDGTFKTYLLEKSRVVRQSPMERNFHAFYQLCAGASAELRATLLLQPAERHAYTKTHTLPGGGDDKGRFKQLHDALEQAAISSNEIWLCLAGVLHLGDIAYDGDDDGSSVRAAAPVEAAARLLGFEEV